MCSIFCLAWRGRLTAWHPKASQHGASSAAGLNKYQVTITAHPKRCGASAPRPRRAPRAASPVISGGNPAPHPIQGIGAGFIPKNLKKELLTGVIQVTKEEAFEYAKRAAREEALFGGISSGASLAAVAKKIPELKKGSRILTFNYDTGERYLSIEGLF